jgi:hypothetical protein
MASRQSSRRDHLIYYVGVAALVAVGVLDWPVALVVATGHILATRGNSKVTRELGEALEAGG